MRGIWLTVAIIGLIVFGVVYFQYYQINPSSELYEGLIYGSLGVVGVSIIMMMFSMGSSSDVQVQPVMGGRKKLLKRK
jgi:FtsH-binding integral membrane protein